MNGAGIRIERIALQARAPDAFGALLGDWETGFKVWARARPLKGSEPVIQARLQGVQPYEFTVRSMARTRAVTEAHRVFWKGRPYKITAIAPTEDRADIAILAEWDQSDA